MRPARATAAKGLWANSNTLWVKIACSALEWFTMKPTTHKYQIDLILVSSFVSLRPLIRPSNVIAVEDSGTLRRLKQKLNLKYWNLQFATSFFPPLLSSELEFPDRLYHVIVCLDNCYNNNKKKREHKNGWGAEAAKETVPHANMIILVLSKNLKSNLLQHKGTIQGPIQHLCLQSRAPWQQKCCTPTK